MLKSIVSFLSGIFLFLVIFFLLFHGFSYEDNLPVPHIDPSGEIVYFETPEGRKKPHEVKSSRYGDPVYVGRQ